MKKFYYCQNRRKNSEGCPAVSYDQICSKKQILPKQIISSFTVQFVWYLSLGLDTTYKKILVCQQGCH